jgi:hypothetical protein
MVLKNKCLVYWLPRIISLAFVLFLSIFALDVFGEYKGWNLVLAFIIHLIPSLFLLLATIVSWKYDLLGALIFLSFAIFYIYSAGLGRPWSWYAFISGPALLIASLFFISWLYKKKVKI